MFKEVRYQYGGVMCDTNDTIEYNRRRSELSNALPRMKQDNTSIEKKALT